MGGRSGKGVIEKSDVEVKLFGFVSNAETGQYRFIREIETALSNAGVDVCVTRMPGGCPVGEGIRRLLEDQLVDMTLEARKSLLRGAAIQLEHDVIMEASKKGKIVLCSHDDLRAPYEMTYRGQMFYLDYGINHELASMNDYNGGAFALFRAECASNPARWVHVNVEAEPCDDGSLKPDDAALNLAVDRIMKSI